MQQGKQIVVSYLIPFAPWKLVFYRSQKVQFVFIHAHVMLWVKNVTPWEPDGFIFIYKLSSQ